MNKSILAIGSALALMLACSRPEPPPVDLAQREKEVRALMDQFHSTMVKKDAAGQMALLTEDGLFCGTDPAELWDKKTIADYLTKGFADTTWVIEPYSIKNREVRMAPDGNSAVIVDQYLMKELSPTITTRLTAHAVMKNGKWVLDFTNLALAPLNKDLKKVSEAVLEEQE